MAREQRVWTESEIDTMIKRYSTDGPAKLAAELGRTYPSVQRKAFFLGLTSKKDLSGVSPEEKAAIRKEQERIKARAKLLEPEARQRRKETVLAYSRQRRSSRRADGICIRCKLPSIEHSNQFCLLHWASTMGHTCKQYSAQFAQMLLDKLQEQDYKCALTGDVLIPGLNCSIDHIVPKSKGGSLSDPANLRWVTIDANRAKGDMSDDEFISFCDRVVAHSK